MSFINSIVFGIVALGSLTPSILVSADVFLPNVNLRRQLSLNCWAYGPAMMLEARFQRRENAAVAIDVEYDAYDRLIEDRLINAFRRRKPSDQLFGIGATSADYFHILAQWGADTYALNLAPHLKPPQPLPWPFSSEFLIETRTSKTEVSPHFINLLNLQKKLVAAPPESLTETEAREKIHWAIAEVFHLSHPTPVAVPWPVYSATLVSQKLVARQSVFGRLLGSDLPTGYSPNTFLMIGSSLLTRDHENFDGRWIPYDDGRYWALGLKDSQKLLSLVRASLDRGWPTTLEPAGHITTALGYHSIRRADGKQSFVYAVVDGDGTVFQPGISWQSEEKLEALIKDITVFAPVLRDLIPPAPPPLFKISPVEKLWL